MRIVLQNLPEEPQRFRRSLGNLWEPGPLFEVRLLFLPTLLCWQVVDADKQRFQFTTTSPF